MSKGRKTHRVVGGRSCCKHTQCMQIHMPRCWHPWWATRNVISWGTGYDWLLGGKQPGKCEPTGGPGSGLGLAQDDWGTVTWTWLLPLVFLNYCLDLPSHSSHNTGQRKDGVRMGWGLFRDELTRESIWFDSLGTWLVSDGKVKMYKE